MTMGGWDKFLGQCLGKRLEADNFTRYVRHFSNKHPLPRQQIADHFLRPTCYNSESIDPIIPQYLHVLLSLDLTDVPSILRSVLKFSDFNPPALQNIDHEGQINGRKWRNPYLQTEVIFNGLQRHVASGSPRPKTTQEAGELLLALSQWLKAVVIPASEGNMTHALNLAEVQVALGRLFATAVGNSRVVGVLGKSTPAGVVKDMSQSLTAFTPLLLHSEHGAQLVTLIQTFQVQVLSPLIPVDKKAQAEKEAFGELTVLDSVLDLPIVNSRAAFFIYLSSLLVGRPRVDDDALFNYLHNRYQGDIQTACIDLILASFDVLQNAMFRNEPTLLPRSYLINKVPLLLVRLSHSMFPPLTAEFCITEALNQVDTNAFPTLSTMFDESSTGNMFGDSVRQDFCFACCLHGLIAEDSIEGLLGEMPMQSLPAGGRYTRDDLVQQCISNPERTDKLVEELLYMDGNVGAVSQAIAEVIRQYCHQKETMSLKSLCSNLARQPACLDVLLLFNKPRTVLQSLCELLDGWTYEEDQGEYTPVYEEFGSILLLVLALVHRYNLTVVDLNLSGRTSFMDKLLVRGATSRSMEELSELEKSQLEGWSRGLFNSAEGGGLGDEPMANCPPQDFYLLVPTLFHQVVLAYSSGHLSDEALKGGLEYLVDTFLLPSLVGALTWLAHHLWESLGESNAIIQILQILINPHSTSSDPNTMLGSVLNIVAKSLEHSLRWLQRSEPTRQDIEPLSRALKPHISFSRTAGSDHTELESWTNSQSGGIANNIRHSMQLLTRWSLRTHDMPTSYTYRLILTGLRLLGARRLLSAILEEVKSQTISGNGSVVIDIATAIVGSPGEASDAVHDSSASTASQLMGILEDTSPSSQAVQRRLSLREALRTEAENAPKVYQDDQAQLEVVVRLYRRVEAMMVVQVTETAMLGSSLAALEGPVNGSMSTNMGMGMGNEMLGGEQELNAALNAAAADQGMMDPFGGDPMLDDNMLFGMG